MLVSMYISRMNTGDGGGGDEDEIILLGSHDYRWLSTLKFEYVITLNPTEDATRCVVIR